MKNLILILLLSGCTKFQSPQVSSEMISSAEQVCAQNGSIKMIEYFKTDQSRIYVYCQKQGLVEIDSGGKISIVSSRTERPITELGMDNYKACKNKCKKIKSINVSPFSCECQ